MKWVLAIIFLCLTGCYNQRKAASQFSRAIAFDAKIGSDYCSNTYPPKNIITKDTVISTDTIWGAGEIIRDTLRFGDTIRINTVQILPGKVITNTIHIVDTLHVENTAALKSCEIDKDRLIAVIAPLTSDRDGWKRKAKARLWIILGMGAIIGIGIWTKLATFFKPKI